MSQASLSSPAHRSPAKSSHLVRFLAEMLGADAQASHQHFIARLGQYFDLADSIKISAVHEEIIATTATSPVLGKGAVKAEFERVRAALVSSAVQSFAPGAGTFRLRFPEIRAGMTDEEALSPEPYLAFYVAQQRNMDARIREIHASTRKTVADLSPQLAGLAALDAVLAEPLAVPARRAFAAVPRLLRRRFDALLDAQQTGEAEPSSDRARRVQSIGTFQLEMQGLLLAEIDTRLLPTLGLIEALDDYDDD